jgi:chemotaxis protein methyltransferase WspC
MPIAEIESLLKRTIGLHSASVGLPTIERAVQQRLIACGLKDLPSYVERVRSSVMELQELIETVIVPETWFFRDREAFTALGQFVVQEWLPAPSEKKLRLLSIPCATGEEPYSMAMTLDSVDLPADRFQIVAADISEHALALARKAIYGRNSFRGENIEFRDRFFEASHNGYHLLDCICQQVFFQQGNLLSSDFLHGSDLFHFIFCRNLLIYFDRPAQDRAIHTLKRLLMPGGVLFVGPAEGALLLNHGLISANRPLAFAFRHGTSVSPKQPNQKTISRPNSNSLKAPAPPSKPKLRLKTRKIPFKPPKQPLPAKIVTDLEMAERLADEGRLEEAGKACECYLKQHSSSVEALYLLGVISDASGEREKAGAYYRKALYLNPEHYESLMHLAYAAENTGDTTAAQNLRARARRVKDRNKHG